MQRRRRQLLTRKIQGLRSSRRRGLTTFFLAIVGTFVIMIGGSILGTAGGMLAAYNYFASDLPDPQILEDISLPQTSYVYDRTGARLLARFECQNRESVTFDQIPEPLINATTAAEDRTFWTNDGIDYYAAIRAAWANLQAGGITQGASTLTQQMIDYAEVLRESQAGGPAAPSASTPELGSLAPVATLPPDQAEQPAEEDVCQPPPPRNDPSIPDKIRENIFARNVTAAYPGREGKERILATYLNLVYYGHGSYGIKAAAANYFGITDLTQLSIAQSAFIAGLPQAPSFYDPYQNSAGEPGSEAAAAAAIERRNLVLEAMLRDAYISQAEHDTAVATTWEAMKPTSITTPLIEPHFTYRVRSEAAQILEALGSSNPELDVRTGGYQITTTLDYDLQQVARELVNKWVANLADKNVGNGALVSIDSATGEIVAYIGSIDFNNREDRVQGEFDVAGLGMRQPGSAFKPITYSSAFKDRKASPATLFVDAATQFSLTTASSYIPTNADIQEHGPVLAMDALRYSLNIPSVQMQYLVGAETTAEFAESMGIAPKDYIMGLDPGLTLALGSIPVNLTNMTQAYSAFAAQGLLHQARTIREIRDRDGNIIFNLERSLASTTTEPMTPAEAYLTHWILEGNTDPARNLLWGERAQLVTPDGQRRPAGFKTGTTNDFRDVSGFGYIPGSLTTGVWMGNNNQEPMSNVLGVGLFSADGPLFLWHEFMQRALNEPWAWNEQTPVGQTTFAQPEGITDVSVCRFSGMAATNNCGGPVITMPFLDDFLPAVDNVHGKGCLDLVQYVSQASPARPSTWIAAAQRWSDRMVSKDWGARGDSAQPENPNTRYRISPLYGNPGFPAVCGRVTSTPKPSPSPGASASPGQPGPAPTPGGPPGQNKPTPPPPTIPAPNALLPLPLLLAASSAAVARRTRPRR
ncbi:MAG: transglycosylase domain-containing protein [Chloroflexota bacterium]